MEQQIPRIFAPRPGSIINKLDGPRRNQKEPIQMREGASIASADCCASEGGYPTSIGIPARKDQMSLTESGPFRDFPLPEEGFAYTRTRCRVSIQPPSFMPGGQ